jgi:hypothetical protein
MESVAVRLSCAFPLPGAAASGAGFCFPARAFEFQNVRGIADVGANKETYCASKGANWPTPWLNVLMRLQSEKTLDRTKK